MTIQKHIVTVLLLAGSSAYDAYAGDVSVSLPGISVKAQDNGANTNVNVRAPGASVNAVQGNGNGNGPGKQAGRIDGGRIMGNDISKSTQCNGQPVNIQGNGNQIILNGVCPQVSVNGNENQVTIEQLGKVQVVGNDNQVRWAQALNGAKPQVQSSGNDNQISRQ
ncbi:DUF3060 domain-containing protein [Undibacterium sp. Ji42W]|uniref:DUF3060 domain-containing protein n=1 Tax=Undibacterium sp. Ji42W TaxID=3413039 RepID=UPI003BF40F05